MGKHMGKFGPRLLEAFRFYSGLALRIGISLLLGFLGGYVLDLKFGTRPWFAILGFFVGVGLGFWSIYNLVKPDIKYKRSVSRRGRRKK
ncbi:MAG: AtpZ/AtpI family protein [Firmicutes bacterium]|nr:AtpZ/AtpI family protein [Bacillota bacterium]